MRLIALAPGRALNASIAAASSVLVNPTRSNFSGISLKSPQHFLHFATLHLRAFAKTALALPIEPTADRRP